MGFIRLLFSIILAVLIPPLGVMLWLGRISDRRVLFAFLLFLLGWLPGVIYALVIISGPAHT